MLTVTGVKDEMDGVRSAASADGLEAYLTKSILGRTCLCFAPANMVMML